MANLSGAALRSPLAITGLKLQALAYLAVSALALACDTGTYLAVATFGVGAAAAAVVGYVTGLLVHYGLSRSFVFAVPTRSKSELRLFLEFAASGLFGLAVTVAVIGVAVDLLGFALLPAKIAAVATSFVGVFLIRRFVVFGG